VRKLLITVIVLLLVVILAGALTVYLRPIAVLSAMKRRTLVKSGFVKGTVQSTVGPQRVFVSGLGPRLIFLHGAGDNAGTWEKVAPEFTSKYRVVVVDLAGHGESAPASGPLKMQAMLDGLDGVVMQEPQPAILVGNSLGAWIAMLYAEQHPERVARVVAVDGGPLRGDRVDLAKLPENREDARKIWDAILDPGSPRIPDFILDDVVRESHKGALGRMEKADMEQHLATEESLRSFPVGVDVVWGAADRLVPMPYAERMREEVPAARLVSIPRCGHIPQGECPIAFTKELQAALSLSPPSASTPRVNNAAIREK
jgi:pimeloyl-ACP methyl ester carboxylesterase